MSSQRSDNDWIHLPPPQDSTISGRRYAKLIREVAAAVTHQSEQPIGIRLENVDDLPVRCAASILFDLAAQGWAIDVKRGIALVAPCGNGRDPIDEKNRVRQLELWRRDEQLGQRSTRRFIRKMEKPREHRGRLASVFDLLRDGTELSRSLKAAASHSVMDESALRGCIDPYVQIVDPASRCTFTGLRLLDIWRYFRHTWVTYYSSTPGRTMMILIRDRAAEYHPVIGIAALASPIVQISERDKWIGWESDQYITKLTREPTSYVAQWLWRRLDQNFSETYLDDLIADGLYWPSLWSYPNLQAIDRLRKEAESSRREHVRFVRASDHKQNNGSWASRAETYLFRSKRCTLLADLLAARIALLPFLRDTQSSGGLRNALKDSQARKAISGIIRRAKGSMVGTAIADLSVCGSVPPYSPLIGGKLVAMLCASPTVVRAYEEKYASVSSEIASSMAGRPINRPAHLVYLGTTSLYGSGSSQYNRLRIPAGVVDESSAEIEFKMLGRSRSYGTSHLSGRTMKHLVALVEQSQGGRRMNSIFGEGVNPKLRKVREAIDVLGWPADHLLRHGRARLVYGVPLVRNLLPYLLGQDATPDYLFDVTEPDDIDRISSYWMNRWLAKRVQRPEVLEAVAQHRLTRPVSHGARVILPLDLEEDI